MKVSEKWLREWVNPSLSAEELMAQVTMAGLEVDGFEPVADVFSGVLVGEITTCGPHPNADKLQVCTVNDGETEHQVVCGAPNAKAGLKVAFATVGAVLPGDFKIKKAKLREVESFGMLCSEKELGISDANEGIMELPQNAPVGEDIRQFLSLDDIAIDIDLTPNRADCLSVRGLARELGVLNQIPVIEPEISSVNATHDKVFPVEIQDDAGCPRYACRVLTDVNVSANTPTWLVERLRRSGIRSIDPVVDVTNYVMIELGQPMHGFDLETLNEKIIVRRAVKGEKLTLLDGQTLELNDSVLTISDANGPLAMAGIMGGEHSGVSSNTTTVLLESAFFAPIQIAGKARSFGLHTDSSHRFERGVDFDLQVTALERATELLAEICDAKPGPISVTQSESKMPNVAHIELSSARLSASLGITLENERIEEILTGLGFILSSETDGQWHVTAPSWRFDMAIEADLIEEVARVYGYNNLPVTAPAVRLNPKGELEQHTPESMLVDRLVSLGYQEAITYSFVEPEFQARMFPNHEGVKLANPISADMSVMRVSLWSGLLKALNYNVNRQQNKVRLFETGLRFRQEAKGLKQIQMLAGVVSGPRLAEGWYSQNEKTDFYDVKGDLEQLFDSIKGVEFEFVPGTSPALHPGQCARVEREGKLVGYIGALHPNLANELGLKETVYMFELRLDRVLQAELPAFKPLSKHPASTRDLAVVVDEDVSVNSVLDTMSEMAGEDLTDLNLFDIYRGKGIDSKRKSLAVGLTWQNRSRTLTDDEINRLMTNMIDTLQSRFDAALRG